MMVSSKSRTKKTIVNITSVFMGQSKHIMNFAVRTVFIYTLSIEYLGINGLFLNILAFLSLAELGVASAMVYGMYAPIAVGDEKKVHVYMELFKKIYISLGIVILLIGSALIPFLDFFYEQRPDIPNLEFIFFLYVLNYASTYFFAYKGSIFRAHQQQYIVTNNDTFFALIQSIGRVIILLVFKDFILYLIISIIIVLLQNIVLARKADKVYPYLRNKPTENLSKQEKKVLLKNVSAMFFQKLGNVVLRASDNIILSKYAGLVIVGLYSNYALIIGIIRSAFSSIIDAILPSVGNLCAKSTSEHSEKIFYSLLLLNIWGMGFFCISLLVLLNPFIELWIGNDYTLSIYVVLFSVISLFIEMTIKAAEMIKSANGLFWNDRYVPFIQSIINIIISVILVQKWGVAGIFIGTSLAMLTTSFFVTPYIIYKNYFKKSITPYFLRFALYTGVTFLAGMVTIYASDFSIGNEYINFIYKFICCLVIPNFIFLISFWKSASFKRIVNLLGLNPGLGRK